MRLQLKTWPFSVFRNLFSWKKKHDAKIYIFQSKKRDYKNPNDLLPITQFCFTFHLYTDFTTNFRDLNK